MINPNIITLEQSLACVADLNIPAKNKAQLINILIGYNWLLLRTDINTTFYLIIKMYLRDLGVKYDDANI